MKCSLALQNETIWILFLFALWLFNLEWYRVRRDGDEINLPFLLPIPISSEVYGKSTKPFQAGNIGSWLFWYAWTWLGYRVTRRTTWGSSIDRDRSMCCFVGVTPPRSADTDGDDAYLSSRSFAVQIFMPWPLTSKVQLAIMGSLYDVCVHTYEIVVCDFKKYSCHLC